MNRHSHTGTFFMLMLAALLLPSASFGGEAAGGRNDPKNGFCNEFGGSSYKAEGGKQAGGCPTEGRVGTCLVHKGRGNESRYRYYTDFPGFGVKPKGGAAVAAGRQCAKLKGEWTPN